MYEQLYLRITHFLSTLKIALPTCLSGMYANAALS